MDRRGFLARLGGAAVVAAVGPALFEVLPSLPAVTAPITPVAGLCSLDEINAITMKRIMPGIADEFFRNSPLLAFTKKQRDASA